MLHFGVHRFSRLWLRRLRAAALACVAITGCARLVGARGLSASAPDGTTFHQVPIGRDERTFLLHRPPGTPAHPLPVLFVLHGTSANANLAMEESGMNAVADSLGALVVYPNGTGGVPYIRLFWNTEHCCAGESRRGVDEIGMVRGILDSLARHFPVDRSRVGLIGFSDAGTMAYLLACDASETLTAIGVISGELPESTCTPPAGVSTLVFHGTADRNIRYGRTAESVAEWAARERCAAPAVDTIPEVIRTTYSSCANTANVELYTILGGRHAWPGGARSWFLAPRPSRTVDASRLFAAFVLNHPRATR
ncbi:MAG: lipoprotein [Gemmatimonadetes bacterium]|nr:lipoprotein [Gemmatimonadota bacterium]